MTDLTAAGAAITATKAAFDLAKTILDVQGTVKVQAKAIELQQQILAAQQSALTASETQTALLRRIDELEAEIARLKEWNANKDDYRFEDVGSGSFVYSPKAEPTETKPNEWLCVPCFEAGQRGVLQNQGRTKDGQLSIFSCPKCKNAINVHWRRGPHNRGELMSDGSRRPS